MKLISFEWSSYHLMLTGIGLTVILARWLPKLIASRSLSPAPILIGLSALAVMVFPSLPVPPDPRTDPKLWETAAEITVIIALFGAGMRIDRIGPWQKWMPTLRLLAIAMPLTILAVSLLGVAIGGLATASAIVLAAAAAPTDPVLAADLQIAPPHEGNEHPVRFGLTTEAALNDGLAFPFIYFGLIVAAQGLDLASWGTDWLLNDVLYRIIVGGVIGWAGGWLLAQILFSLPKSNRLADTGSGVVAIAGVLLCYGSTELVEGYGFIAVTMFALSLRRVESDHEYHRKLHDFSESVEQSMTAVLLVALGAVLPALFADLKWSHVAISMSLLLLVRPLSGWVSLLGTDYTNRERSVVAFFGVRGIGSIYYLAYAATHADLPDLGELWVIAAFTIATSTVLHGFSVSTAMKRINER